MGRADYLELGDWNAVCYQCGRKRKASTLVRHWQGYYLCPEHNEPRQPQDFARAVPDNQTPPWVQPMPANVFAQAGVTLYGNGYTTPDVYSPYCTPNTVSAVPTQAAPGCCAPGYLHPDFHV